jgi:hypothetical protein
MASLLFLGDWDFFSAALLSQLGPSPCATYVVYLTVLAVTFFTRDNHGVLSCTSIVQNRVIRHHKGSSNK